MMRSVVSPQSRDRALLMSIDAHVAYVRVDNAGQAGDRVSPMPIDADPSHVHPEDVGALFGQIATIGDREPLDSAAADEWQEALTRALTGQSGRGTL